MKNNIKNKIEKGLDYLVKIQKRDGSFNSLTARDGKYFSDFIETNSIFPSCLILSCLSEINTNKIKPKLSGFLLSQKSEYGTFNYWKRDSEESRKNPYPDDFDDTFCALSGLYLSDKKLISGKLLAKIVMLLASFEKKEGGPYYTWITPPGAESAWRDVDIAVNSNIAFFLSFQDVSLKSIDCLIKNAIEKKRYFSPYYSSFYPVIYFISRFYRKKEKGEIIKFILSKRNGKGTWGNPLDSALAISSLLNFGFSDLKIIGETANFLISCQNKNGGWNAFPFTIEKEKGSKKYYSGSPGLTAAFCLEALGKCLLELEKMSTKSEKNDSFSDPEAELLGKDIEKMALERFSGFDRETRKIFADILSLTIKNDKKSQITLLPCYFRKSLGSKGKKISDQQIKKLGLANLLGWIAYSIYDDFFDNEGAPKQLPVANICLREVSKIFSDQEISQNDFQPIFSEIMDKLDSAGTWEMEYCRTETKNGRLVVPQKLPGYSDYRNLFERSMGHALGPIAILSLLGFGKNSPEMKNTILFFRHYIIAKQLDDDSHDWEKDLRRGQLSPVATEIIRTFRKKYKKKYIKFSSDSNRLRKIFWYETIIDICSDISKNSKLAKKYLKKIRVIENRKLFELIVDSIEKSAEKTIEEQKNTIEFLKSM